MKQSYYLQGAARANKSKQNFEWANFLLQFVKEDKDIFYNKFEALFPVE
jgi:GTP-sensing pleiotropic transcriptional regulator CodY